MSFEGVCNILAPMIPKKTAPSNAQRPPKSGGVEHGHSLWCGESNHLSLGACPWQEQQGHNPERLGQQPERLAAPWQEQQGHNPERKGPQPERPAAPWQERQEQQPEELAEPC